MSPSESRGWPLRLSARSPWRTSSGDSTPSPSVSKLCKTQKRTERHTRFGPRFPAGMGLGALLTPFSAATEPPSDIIWWC